MTLRRSRVASSMEDSIGCSLAAAAASAMAMVLIFDNECVGFGGKKSAMEIDLSVRRRIRQ